jgi:acyl-coenzyme A synthetase/AMP-(fatty) acid ligase/acyl carrier protein
MASLLRFADPDYFLNGTFFEDLKKDHPILVDPLWQGTSLERQLSDSLLPKQSNPQTFSLVTSGSTGSPKMVWKHWDEIQKEVDVWLSETNTQTFFQDVEEIHVQVPLCHLYGLLWGYLLPKALGIPIVMGQSKTETPAKLSITSAPQLQMAVTNAFALPERAIVSGMKFPVPLARDLRELGGISLLEIYGSTETGGMGYRDPLRQNRFIFLQEVQIQFQTFGEENELLVKSPFVSKHYDTFETNEWVSHHLPPNSYYATGDLGENSDLGFYLIGRKDRIIKHKGKRVSLDRVESEILGLRLEGQFVCVPVHHERGDTIGLFTDSRLPIDHLYQTLRNELPDSHVPRVILRQNSIPKLPNGKLDYQSITKLCLNEYIKQIATKDKEKQTIQINSETTVAEILSSILGYIPKPNDHLIYDCGMDSIQFTEMFLKLETKIGSKIPEEDKQTGFFMSLSGMEGYLKDKLYLQ